MGGAAAGVFEFTDDYFRLFHLRQDARTGIPPAR